MPTQPSAADRIEARRDDRIADIAVLFKHANGDDRALSDFRRLRDLGVDVHDEDWRAYDRLAEYYLGASERRVIRIDISTGGPGDYFEAEVVPGDGITRITYHFVDWYDHAEVELDGEDFETAEAFISSQVEF